MIYGVIEAGQDGWGSAGVLAPIAAGVVLLAGFLVWERRASHPLIDLALFSNRDFTIGTALSTITNFALFGLLFVMPQYFQDVGGSDPLGTGSTAAADDRGPHRRDPGRADARQAVGRAVVIIAGLALCAAGMALGATTSVTSPYAFAALWIALVGAGIGLTLPAAMATAIGALSMERAGSGSGLIQALRQVGATIGIAVLGTVLSSSYHARLDSGDVPPSVERRGALQRRRGHRSRSSARQLLAGRDGSVGVRPRNGRRAAGLRSPYDRGRRDRRCAASPPPRRDAEVDPRR